MSINVKRTYLGISCLITVFIIGTSLLVAGQSPSPTFQWKCQIGDKYSWQITKLRKNNRIVSVELFDDLNITEGDVIELTILDLRTPNETTNYYPMQWTTINARNGVNEVQVTGKEPFSNTVYSRAASFIFPVADREYYISLTQDYENYELQGNLLIGSGELFDLISTSYMETFTKNISSGLVLSYYLNLTISPPMIIGEPDTTRDITSYELAYNYFEDYRPFLLTVVFLGICSAEIVTIVLLLVQIKNKNLSLPEMR